MLWQPTRGLLQPNQHWRRPQSVAAAGPTTFDPANKSSAITLSNGNLTATGGGATDMARSVAGYTTGKFYCEALATTNNAYEAILGLVDASQVLQGGGSNFAATPDSVGNWENDSQIYGNNNAVLGSMGADNWNNTHYLCMAVDVGASLIWFRVNGLNWNNSGTANPATGTGGISISFLGATRYVGVSCISGLTVNFGATAYTQTPPSGFGNW